MTRKQVEAVAGLLQDLVTLVSRRYIFSKTVWGSGTLRLKLLQKAECFERFANAFFNITRDLLGADMSATVSQREECLIYSYMRLKLLIEEIERDVERARSVPVMPRRRKILNSGTKIKLTKPENIGKSRRTQKP